MPNLSLLRHLSNSLKTASLVFVHQGHRGVAPVCQGGRQCPWLQLVLVQVDVAEVDLLLLGQLPVLPVPGSHRLNLGHLGSLRIEILFG